MNDIEEIQFKMLNEIQARDLLVNELEELLAQEAQADHDAELANAKAYLIASTDGVKRTVEHIKAMVAQQCDESNLSAKLLKARVRGLKARIDTHDSTLSCLQSILAVRKLEAEAVKYGRNAGL